MRYFIREATPLDIARVAEIVGDNAGQWCGSTAAQAVERLHNVWELSTRVWLTLDLDGLPAALFGIAPMQDDAATGHFWMMILDAFDDCDRDLRSVTRLVLDEMLRDFERLENVIDSRKRRAIDLLRSLGFVIEPLTLQAGYAAGCHRVWLSGEPQLQWPAH